MRRQTAGVRLNGKQLNQLQEIWDQEVWSEIDLARGTWSESPTQDDAMS